MRRKYAQRDGNFNVRSKRYRYLGCNTRPTYGVDGSKKGTFCAEYAKDGMVDVYSKRCGYRDCITRLSYGVDGSKKEKLCAAHAQERMVDIRSKRCAYRGCATQTAYGVNGGKNANSAPNTRRMRWWTSVTGAAVGLHPEAELWR